MEIFAALVTLAVVLLLSGLLLVEIKTNGREVRILRRDLDKLEDRFTRSKSIVITKVRDPMSPVTLDEIFDAIHDLGLLSRLKDPDEDPTTKAREVLQRLANQYEKEAEAKVEKREHGDVEHQPDLESGNPSPVDLNA